MRDRAEIGVRMKFRRKQRVRHVKTGVTYVIVHTPTCCRLEAMNEPAYAYRPEDGFGYLWVRSQVEMEDGRFEAVE